MSSGKQLVGANWQWRQIPRAIRLAGLFHGAFDRMPQIIMTLKKSTWMIINISVIHAADYYIWHKNNLDIVDNLNIYAF